MKCLYEPAMQSPPITERPWLDPYEALSDVSSDAPHAPHDRWTAFLDSGGDPSGARGRWSFLGATPVETLLQQPDGRLYRNGRLTDGSPWEHLREMQARLPETPPMQEAPALPFSGGVVGLTSYEAGMALEHVVSRHSLTAPRLMAASYDSLLAFDRLERRCFQVGSPPRLLPRAHRSRPRAIRFQPDMDRETWLAAVREIVRFIGAGDIFQANLTCRWRGAVPDDFDEITAYAALRTGSPAPFGAYLHCPEADFSLLSASVERFLALSADGLVETRPIKGTAPLGHDENEAARFADALRRDAKENAENLMITDLMRNDIGRVCDIGSVAVPQLCAVERFAHVHHLVSSVSGRLRSGLDAFDLLQATLPPGSVTGAPKKRAMEIIDRTELSARGAYCGSVFRVGRDGAMDSSVVIRSVERCGARLSIGAGGGITWPSDPAKEYDEMLLKVTPLLQAFG